MEIHNRNSKSVLVADKSDGAEPEVDFEKQFGLRSGKVNAPLFVFVLPREGKRNEYSIDSINILEDNESNLVKLFLGKKIPDPDCVCFLSEAESKSILMTTFRMRKVPVILYSRKFNASYREMAMKRNFDDYLFGNINEDFLRHIKFLKRLKLETVKESPTQRKTQNLRQTEEMLKRISDIVLSLSLLLILSPLMILVAILVKLDSPGPVFYVSKRAGKGYKVFDFIKFRTMRDGASSELFGLVTANQYGGNQSENVFFKIKEDPRVTKLGRFLRNTSLDELPQFINVLRGDMSFVGNRPLPLYEAEKLTSDHLAWRFLAPAGITGLWQVTKRGKEKMSPRERIDLDIEYAYHNSFFDDMRIIFKTLPAMLQKESV